MSDALSWRAQWSNVHIVARVEGDWTEIGVAIYLGECCLLDDFIEIREAFKKKQKKCGA